LSIQKPDPIMQYDIKPYILKWNTIFIDNVKNILYSKCMLCYFEEEKTENGFKREYFVEKKR
jgi:hypothetical protein